MEKVLFCTNDRKYPFLFKREDGMYVLINKDNMATGDVFSDANDVIKYFPKADVPSEESIDINIYEYNL